MTKAKSPLSTMPIGIARQKLVDLGANPLTQSPYKMALQVLEKHGLSLRGSKATKLRRALKAGQPAQTRTFIPKPKTKSDKTEFYASWEWKKVRMLVLQKHGRRCQCCGASPADGARMVVDHIKPLGEFWALRLDLDNLQVLCNDCNMRKGNWDFTDFREVEEQEPQEDWLTAQYRETMRH